MSSIVERSNHEQATLPDVDTDTSRTSSTAALFTASYREDADENSQDSVSLEDMCESVKDFNQKCQTSVAFSPTKFLAAIAKGQGKVDEGDPMESSQNSGVTDHTGAERQNEANSHEPTEPKRLQESESELHFVSEPEEMLGSKIPTVNNSLCGSSLGVGRIPDDVAANELQSALSEIPLGCTEELQELYDNGEEEQLKGERLDDTGSSATTALDTMQVLPAECDVSLDGNSNLSGSPIWFISSPNLLGSALGPSPVVASQHSAMMSDLDVPNVPCYLLVVPTTMFEPPSTLTEAETSETERVVKLDTRPKHCPERASVGTLCSTSVRVSPYPESSGLRSSSLVRVSRSGTPIQPLVGRKQQFVIVQGNNRDEKHWDSTKNRAAVEAQQDSSRGHSPIYLQGLRPQGFQRLRNYSAGGVKTAAHPRSSSEPTQLSVHDVGKSPLTNVKQKSLSNQDETEPADKEKGSYRSDTGAELPNENFTEETEGDTSSVVSLVNNETYRVGNGCREKRKRIEDKEKKKQRDRKYDSGMKEGFHRLKQLVPESRKAANRLTVLNETEKYIEALQTKIRELYRQRQQQTRSIYSTLVCNESLSPSHSLGSESEAVVPEAEQTIWCESMESPLVPVPDELAINSAEGNQTPHCTTRVTSDAEDEPEIQENDEQEETARESHWNIQGGNQDNTPVIMNDSNSENTLTPSPFFVVPSVDLSPSSLLSPLYLAHSPGALPEGHNLGVLNEQGAFLVSQQGCSSEQPLYLVPTSPVGPFTEEVATNAVPLVSYQADCPEDVEIAAVSGFLGSTICEEDLSELGVMLSPFQSPERSANRSLEEDAEFERFNVVEGSANSFYSPDRLVPSFLFESHSPGFTSVAASVEISTGPTENGKKTRRQKSRRNSSPNPEELLLSDKKNTFTPEMVQGTEVRPLIDTTNQGVFSPVDRRKRKRPHHNDWSRGEDLGDENVHPNLAKVQVTPQLPKRLPGRPRKPAKRRKVVSTRGRATRRGRRNTPQQLHYNE